MEYSLVVNIPYNYPSIHSTAYSEEVHALTRWCQENHLSLNINKTKELMVDLGDRRENTPPSSSTGHQWNGSAALSF